MIEGKEVLAIIPARGGSKAVPRKNVRLLKNKPLMAWSIEAARASRIIDRLVVSSEDEEIIRIARDWGCEVPFVRPAELARDDSPGMAPVLHVLAELPIYEYVVVLQPTSPLRLTRDIDECIKLCHTESADSCISVTGVAIPPQWTFVKQERGLLKPLMDFSSLNLRRQDLVPLVAPNGAVYCSHSTWLLEGHSFFDGRVVSYEMPPERSLDIDTEWDWHLLTCIADGPTFVR